jgi:hypothetical protein
VNSHIKEQLYDFAQQVILPGLELVQQYCDRQGHRAWVVPSLPTGDEIFDQLLEENIHNANLQGLIAALRVEEKVVVGSASPLTRSRFYLAIEGSIQADGAVVGLPLVFYDRGDGCGFQCFSNATEAHKNGAMPILKSGQLMDTFINRFEAFRVPLPVTSAVPQTELTPVEKVEPVRHFTGESVAEPVRPSIERSSGDQIRAERLKIEALQEEETKTLLSYLKLSKKSFRELWVPDLERGSVLSRKMIEKRPLIEGEYQLAFDALAQQATQFAWSLKPNLFSEFADYFELYWTVAERDCVSSQGNRTYEDAFVAQVVALGEPEDINQANVKNSMQMRSVVRSIELKFGRPDTLGRRDFLGFTDIPTSLSIEEMIDAIQGRSQQFLVRFEELSWGVLQVCQNAGFMPPSQQKLGRHVVLSFWRSARLTIERPTEAVVCTPVDARFFEFRFVRQIVESGIAWRAIAVVRISQVYGRVTLHTYRFEGKGSYLTP